MYLDSFFQYSRTPEPSEIHIPARYGSGDRNRWIIPLSVMQTAMDTFPEKGGEVGKTLPYGYGDEAKRSSSFRNRPDVAQFASSYSSNGPEATRLKGIMGRGFCCRNLISLARKVHARGNPKIERDGARCEWGLVYYLTPYLNLVREIWDSPRPEVQPTHRPAPPIQSSLSSVSPLFQGELDANENLVPPSDMVTVADRAFQGSCQSTGAVKHVVGAFAPDWAGFSDEDSRGVVSVFRLLTETPE
jgi:hypothetical protein